MSISQSAANPLSPSTVCDRNERLVIEHLMQNSQPTASEAAGSDVMAGLSHSPKTLSARYFYDDRGSHLFEQICELPEYYLTRTETAILQESAAAIVRHTGACELVELGSGSSTKTRILLTAYQQADLPLVYRPIDVSTGMLVSSAHALLADYAELKVQALAGTYEQGLQHLSTSYLPCRLISFLGSSLGNLEPGECDRFFDQIVGALRSGDFFLLGVDLHKDRAQLEAAYNDAQGVTADFNLNMLRHLNHRFHANFDLSQFEHWAFYNEADRQIEMHLRSLTNQTVSFADLKFEVTLTAGETIRSEISRKFERSRLELQLMSKGLHPVQTWTDPNQWFALMLFQR